MTQKIVYFRASAAYRELECTASWRLYRDHADEIKAQKSSDAAQRGTDFHKIVENLITGNTIINADPELHRWAQQCKSYVDGLEGLDAGVQRYVERKVCHAIPLTNSTIAVFGGTVDYGAEGEELHLVDWKSGYGRVMAKDNPQLGIYTLGWGKVGDKRITVHIAQPSLNHFDSAEISKQQLSDFEQYAAERAHEAITAPVFRPSHATCNFCFFLLRCKAFKGMVQETLNIPEITAVPAEVSGKNFGLESLTDAQLVKLKLNQKIIGTFFALAEAEMRDRMMRGVKIDGWKLGESVKHRVLNRKDEAVAKLTEKVPEEMLYEKKMVSLTKMASLWGKTFYEDFKDFIFKPKGDVVVVPESSKDRDAQDFGKDFD